MEKKNDISRREFLKTAGVASALSLGLAACGDGRTAGSALGSQAVPSGGMTYRTNPTTGDKVSLLGYGCMRWPSVGGRSAREGNEEIDQEMVNRLVDYAIEYGVNYFDTSPAYCRGTSERATGIALSRHPREKYLIATKLSNFAPSTWTREGAIAMYRNSMKELRVDYLDYYLLHGIGMGGGMEEMMARYFDNGIIDFLMEERKAGRIRNLGFSYHGDVKCFDWLLERHDVYKWDFVQIQLNYLDWKYAKQINPRNTDAEYLYNALAERGIPAIIMEPLLGGRLSNVPDNIVAQFKERDPQSSVASWAFRFAGSLSGVLTVLSGMTLSPRYSCITTNASMRATSPSPPPTRSTARPAAPISWDTTGAYPGCVRRPTASAAASAAPIVPSVSTSPLSCTESTLTSSGLGRILCRRCPPHYGLRLWRNSLPLFCSNFKSADRPWMNSALKYL